MAKSGVILALTDVEQYERELEGQLKQALINERPDKPLTDLEQSLAACLIAELRLMDLARCANSICKRAGLESSISNGYELALEELETLLQETREEVDTLTQRGCKTERVYPYRVRVETLQKIVECMRKAPEVRHDS